MYQLSLSSPPQWKTVATATATEPAIRIQFRAGPTEALNAARRLVRLMAEEDPDTDRDFAFILGAVAWGAVAWEGVGLPLPEGGDPLAEPETAPLTIENLTLLLRHRPDIYMAVDREYVDGIMEALSEKNESAPLQSGTSGADPSSAATATASVQSAPIGSEGQKPKPGKRSGPRSKDAPDSSVSE